MKTRDIDCRARSLGIASGGTVVCIENPNNQPKDTNEIRTNKFFQNP